VGSREAALGRLPGHLLQLALDRPRAAPALPCEPAEEQEVGGQQTHSDEADGGSGRSDRDQDRDRDRGEERELERELAGEERPAPAHDLPLELPGRVERPEPADEPELTANHALQTVGLGDDLALDL
jgi:hypothetical protein